MPFADFYAGKRVLVTGHTGFKGAWLSEWLLELGAYVTGLSLPPDTEPALFNQLGLATRLDHRLVDVRDPAGLRAVLRETRPDVLFHLAAQPLVRASYRLPAETYAINVMGTVHVLDALRDATHPCAAVIITTDKCYENREWLHSYREDDPLGGHDPYSSSKGCAEIAVSSFRRSFFHKPARAALGGIPVAVASARAGNVIGGGDWAQDRIVPDCVRHLLRGEPIRVRNPHATRPWQHVLEPLSGYLWLAALLHTALSTALDAGPGDADDARDDALHRLASAFNFGPAQTAACPVSSLVNEFLKHWPGTWIDDSAAPAPHEARFLNLATDKAWRLLHWHPAWDFPTTIARTAEWYRLATFPGLSDVRGLTTSHIRQYLLAARRQSLPWTCAPLSPAPADHPVNLKAS